MKKIIILYTGLFFGLFNSSPLMAQIEVIATDTLSSYNPIYFDTLNLHTQVDSSFIDTNLKATFWIHGVAGNQNSWGKVAAVTELQDPNLINDYPARQTVAYVLKYDNLEDANLNLIEIAAHMERYMQGELRSSLLDSLDERKNIAIAHSQGGILGRTINMLTQTDYRYNPSYGALATFGSPHRGALIANSTISNGLAQAWLTDGCKAISHAEILTFKNSIWLLDLVVSNQAVANLTSSSCEGLGKTVLPTLIHQLRKPTAENYRIGSPSLAMLDSFAKTDTIPVVTFYGIEQEPVMWRVIHSLTKTSDSIPSGSILYANPFGLNNDDGLPNYVNQHISIYDSKRRSREFEATLIRNTAISALNSAPMYSLVFDPFKLFYAKKMMEAKAYQDAKVWLSTANPTWKRLIGARRDTSYIEDYHCECFEWTPNGIQYSHSFVQNPGDCNQNGLSNNCNVIPRIKHIIFDEPSDGVVTVSSQRGYSGRKVGEMVMINTNHMQMRNCLETQRRLKELFDGAYGTQFILNEL